MSMSQEGDLRSNYVRGQETGAQQGSARYKNDRDLRPGIRRGRFATKARRGRVFATLRLRGLGFRYAQNDKNTTGHQADRLGTPYTTREQAAHGTTAADVAARQRGPTGGATAGYPNGGHRLPLQQRLGGSLALQWH